MTALAEPVGDLSDIRSRWAIPLPDRPRGGVAYYLAFLAVFANILDTWIYPASGLNTGGLKFHGLRITDELCLLSLLVSLALWLTGRLKIPGTLGIPLGLASTAFLLGLMVGLHNHHDLKVIFAECHILIHIAAITLAWLQVPEPLVRRHESLLLPLTFAAVLYILPSTAGEKGGDISTIAAGVAAIALVRHRWWASIPLTVLTAALVLTGGQRAAILFSFPPLIFAALIVISRRRWSREAIALWTLVPAVIAGVLAVFSNTVAAFVSKTYTHTFHRVGKVESSDSRKQQLAIAEEKIRESPVWGHGLGFRYKLFEPTTDSSSLTDITHNIYVDVTLRMGFVGLAVFVVIIALGIIKFWRDRHDLTAFRVTVVLILVGLLVHGGVESILDKPRLSVYMGWLLALLLTSPGRRASPS